MHIIPTSEAIQNMMGRIDGAFVMLNLYRLRNVADYSDYPDHAPENPISGRELFDRIAAAMDENLAAVGAKRVFLAGGGSCLIGPADERWDVVQLIHYPSLAAFIALSSNAKMLADMPHRFAMLEDSRVIPLLEHPMD